MRYISVNVAGLEISGGTGKIVLSPGGLDGWDDGVSVRRDAVDRVNAHGSHDAPGYLDARVISITGRVLADSPQECEHIGQRLTGLLAGGQTGRIQVSGATGVQWADCRLAAGTRFTPDYSRRNAVFQIQLWCPNPRKFGESREFTGALGQVVPLWHRGNFDAFPEAVVTASSAGLPRGFTLQGPNGETYKVTRAVGAGDSLRINMAEGFPRFYGGTPVIGGFETAQTWSVPPGRESSIRLGGEGGGTIRVVLKDTYI